jgi:hypothetical protein
MTKAKVTAPFPGRPDEEAKVRQIEAGEIISGELAEVAIREGWAEVIADESGDGEKPPERHSHKDGRQGRKNK